MRAFAGDIHVEEGKAVLLHVSIDEEAHISLKACCVHRGKKVIQAPEPWNQISILPVQTGDMIKATDLAVRIRGFTLADVVEVMETQYHEPSEGCERARPLTGKLRRRRWNEPLHLHVRFHDLPKVADPLLRFITPSDWAHMPTMMQIAERFIDFQPHEVAADLSDMMTVDWRMEGQIWTWPRRSMAVMADAVLVQMAHEDLAGTQGNVDAQAAWRLKYWRKGDAAKRAMLAVRLCGKQGLLEMKRLSRKMLDGREEQEVEDFKAGETEWYVTGSIVFFKMIG